MDTEVDLTTVDRDVLIAIIAELQAVIERLQRRIAELAGPAKPGDPLRMPGLKAKSGRKPPAQQGPRQQRRHGFARPRLTPTHRVEHVMENCPDCGAHWSGGWIQRTREVIELPVVPVQVTEQVYIARTCPACRRRCTPPAELDGVVLGQQRRGVNLLSLIATLREEGRRPTPEYWSAISMLPTTIMMAPSSGAGRTPVQARGRLCWDIHDQRTRYPKDAAPARWAAAVHQLYVSAKACNHHEPWQRRVAQLAWERKLLVICRPFLSDPSAVQGKLCRRIERHLKSLPRTGYG